MNAEESIISERFDEGDGVCIKEFDETLNPNAVGAVGIVTHIQMGKARVLFIRSGKGNKIAESIVVRTSILSNINDLALDEDDIHTLIDMALDTNDKEWFLELTDRLPKELVGW